jgi:5-formyltetrahydrofolate cyclo-ligase
MSNTSHTPHALKQEIRRRSREQSTAIAADADRLSPAIQDLLASSSLWQNARSILAFLPLPRPAAEPDLSPLFAAALAQGRRVCLPRIDWQTGQMQPAVIASLEDLETTKHGVRQPRPGSPAVPLSEIDLILVPGLAFDLKGNRLGRGAGFYDRFLAQRTVGPPACGICFEAQLVDRIPTEPWDVPMNGLATERRLVTLST